jgi:AcrR family transcriptional regulator
VLAAAFAAFTENGFAATRTLDIAMQANISKRDLYQICADKSQLLRQAIAERAGQMLSVPELPVATNREALAATLASFGLASLSGIHDRAVLALYRLAAAEAANAPEVAQMLDELGREASRAALSRALARAQSDGLISEGDPVAQAEDFTALLWGDLLLRLALRLVEPPPQAELERRAQDATDKFLKLYGA